MGTICEMELDRDSINISKVKILKTQCKSISIGIASSDFDVYTSDDTTCGWYIYLSDSSLYSGSPHNYKGKTSKLKKIRDEIKIVMDIKERTLKFIIDDEDKVSSYTNITTDKPLFPAICLYNTNDSVEILDC